MQSDNYNDENVWKSGLNIIRHLLHRSPVIEIWTLSSETPAFECVTCMFENLYSARGSLAGHFNDVEAWGQIWNTTPARV